MSKQETEERISTILLIGIIGFIAILVGGSIYTISVIGPENQEKLDAFKSSLKEMSCPDLKQMIYERNYPINKAGYTYNAEHEYEWRCHNP